MENSDRIACVMKEPFGVIHNEFIAPRVKVETEFEDGTYGDLIMCHDGNYLSYIKTICLSIPPDRIRQLDTDTAITRETWKSSIRAVGAVIHTVNEVMLKRAKNGFCPIRPPGHHSGIFGPVSITDDEIEPLREKCPGYKDLITNGFCIFNNVAVAAGYLMNVHRASVKRIAIIDFDIHHGNGTEDILECLKYPGKTFSETSSEIIFGEQHREKKVYKPWLTEDDFSNVFFVSSHLHDQSNGIFYPGSGSLISKQKTSS